NKGNRKADAFGGFENSRLRFFFLLWKGVNRINIALEGSENSLSTVSTHLRHILHCRSAFAD
ncbi:MAG: hypothetical protein V3S93_06960, partial [Methyloceanibacter sp.]